MSVERFVALAIFLACVGCGGPAFELVPVSGKVTWKDKPLPDAFVSFAPDGSAEPGPTSFAKTDKEGKFSLQAETIQKPGAVVGKHVVRITTAVAQADDSDVAGKGAKSMLPEKYHSNSELRFVVPPGGTNQANFDLRP